MSTIGYAAITNTRDASPAGATFADATDAGDTKSKKIFVDALAALVPAEVLAAHAVVISWATKTENKVVTITHVDWLKGAFWVLFILSLLFYVVPRYFGGHWEGRDFLRLFIPGFAFIGWTMLHPMSAFDAIASLDQGPRAICAVLLAMVLGLAAAALAYQLDKKPPAQKR